MTLLAVDYVENGEREQVNLCILLGPVVTLRAVSVPGLPLSALEGWSLVRRKSRWREDG